MKPLNLAQKILFSHLVGKKSKLDPVPGDKIAIRIDQTLTQDATGTLVYMEFESLHMDTIKTIRSVSYVDHNTLQTGFENSDDHRFLRTIAARYGLVFSPPGNGICHQLHLENFSVPGQTLLGSDSHTPTCGGAGMIAIGAGGLDIACAMAGEPFHLTMPEIVNVSLAGKLAAGVSAKDIILQLLQQLTVKGGFQKIFEYSGTGLKNLSVYDRATITNMGTELGSTTSLFPADEITEQFFVTHRRKKDYAAFAADKTAKYDGTIKLDLSETVPMIACPHNPDNVKPVSETAGTKVDQVCIGSCTNSSYDDMLLVASMLKKHKIHPGVELTISPGSKQILSYLAKTGDLEIIYKSGARVLEPTCGPCIGMGQAPVSGAVSLRTFNRNFKGRSGTADADVYLCSTETAIVSAITGEITDPRELIKKPGSKSFFIKDLPEPNFVYPFESDTLRKKVAVVRGPNIKPLPEFTPLPDTLKSKIILRLGNNISTDDILPAGAKILPLRSNIPAIAEYTFTRVDKEFVARAKNTLAVVSTTGVSAAVIAGENYGQGSSREHAAIVLRYLGVSIIISKSIARIHMANLVNFGVLPVIFENPADYDKISMNTELVITGLIDMLKTNKPIIAITNPGGDPIKLKCLLGDRDKKMLLAGGLLNLIRTKI
jgi:aconitate hydratase